MTTFQKSIHDKTYFLVNMFMKNHPDLTFKFNDLNPQCLWITTNTSFDFKTTKEILHLISTTNPLGIFFTDDSCSLNWEKLKTEKKK